MGSQDAEDNYDVIEAVARMDWCNGSVGMAGNSALAISQWFMAALNPPSFEGDSAMGRQWRSVQGAIRPRRRVLDEQL
jgi:hypothetical protein